jgi:pyruvate dehydrogenase E2 component (dihydrolipoamide acetyltransferase)
MPSLGADMESGKLLEWRVAPGDQVHRGDIVATVDTSKADIDIEVFEDGVVEDLVVQPGESVPVGAVLATIRGAQAPAAAPPLPTAPPPAATPPLPPTPPRAAAPPPAAPGPPIPDAHGGRVLASPYARRLAAERGAPLDGLAGRGPGGAVLAADVPAGEPDRATSMRQAIAAAMSRSKREIPHYYLALPIDMSAALRWLAAHNGALPVAQRLLPAVLTLKATALAAREVPALNGYWIDGSARPSPAVHVGVAIALRTGGLIAPAIHDADAKPLDVLMSDLRDLVRRVRSGGLRSSELTDPTITVTSLGERGAHTVFGVIYPPQVALVGFGASAERAWAENGVVSVRPVLDVTLAADHRASDGHQGSTLLAAIERHLQEPETL